MKLSSHLFVKNFFTSIIAITFVFGVVMVPIKTKADNYEGLLVDTFGIAGSCYASIYADSAIDAITNWIGGALEGYISSKVTSAVTGYVTSAISGNVPTHDEEATNAVNSGSAQIAQRIEIALQQQTKSQVTDKTVSDCIIYGVGQAVLNQLTEDMLAWINGGFQGNPRFTVDTHKIFLDLADMVAGDLARELRGIAMCDFRVNFKNDLANTVELSSKRQYKFEGKTKCPFPETFGINSSDFYKGVNKFSWAGLEYAMQDSGNPFGIAMLTGEELAARSSEKAEVRKQELAWSSGFTSMVDTDNCNYPEGVDLEEEVDGEPVYSDAAKREFQKTYCKTITPGKIVGDQLTKITGIDMDRLGAVDSLNKIIAAVIDQVTKKAAEGIFEAVSGEDIEIPTDYVTAAEKTAETIAMENAALKPYYDAWQAEKKKDTDAQAELVRLQQELSDIQASGNVGGADVQSIEARIAELEAIIQAAPERIAAAKAAYDDASLPERSIARQQELQAAQAEVDAATEAKKTAEYNAMIADKNYYATLMTEVDAGIIANKKQAMNDANAVLAQAKATLSLANDRLYAAQHPAYVAPSQ